MVSTGRPKMMLRAVAYGAYGGDRIGVLHHATKISLTTSISGVPTLKLTHTEEPNPALEEENEVAVEVTFDGGRTWSEPAGGRFLVRKATWNLLSDGTKSRTIDCVHISARLKQALVWEENFRLRKDPNKPAQGNSTTDVPADLVIQTWLKAKDRGWGRGLTFKGAPAADANGNAWTKYPSVKGMEVKWTSTLWSLLESFQQIGAIQPRWEGRQLVLVPPVNKPLESLHPKRWPAGRTSGGTNSLSWADIATAVHVLGKDGVRFKVPVPTDPNFDPREGREISLEANWVETQSDAATAAQEALLERSRPKEEIVRDWQADQPGCFLPWVDYNVGDWFWVEHAAGRDQWLRVSQIQVDYAEGYCSGSTIFGTMIANAQTRLAQEVAASKLSTGTAAASTAEPVRSRSSQAKVAQTPAVIRSNTLEVKGTVTDTGSGLETLVEMAWPAPKLDVNGVELKDKIVEYRVRIARVRNFEVNGTKEWLEETQLVTTANKVAWGSAELGVRYLFWVQARTDKRIPSDWDESGQMLRLEWTQPPTPEASRPIVLSQMGVATILFNGTTANRQPAPWWANRWQVSIHLANTAEPPNGWKATGSIYDKSVTEAQAALVPGEKYNFRVRLLAQDGKPGPWSRPFPHTVASAIDTEALVKKLTGSQQLIDGAKAAIDKDLRAIREAQERLAGAMWGGQFPPDEGMPGESLWLDPFGDVYQMKSHY